MLVKFDDDEIEEGSVPITFLQILLTRQAEYKQEALKLYKEGDQVGAKKYLAQVGLCCWCSVV